MFSKQLNGKSRKIYVSLLVLCLSVGAAAVKGDSEKLPVIWMAAAIQEKMERATDISVQAFNDGDYQGSAEIYSGDAYVLAHGRTIISSQPGIVDMLAGMGAGGMQYGYMKKFNQKTWESGRYVYELYDYQIKVTLPNRMRPLYADNRDLSIWEKTPDGQIEIRVDIWSNAVVSGSQPTPIDPNSLTTQFFHVAQSRSNESQPRLMNNPNIIRQLDRQFHQCYINKDIDAILDFYAEDFTLVGLSKPNITSKAVLRMNIEQNIAQGTLLDNNPQIIYSSDSGDMAFVVNTFIWKIKKTDDSIQEYPGKGVHVWKKNEAGQWKLFIDIYNTDVPMN
ncbi:MAG: DUF4440 domain-containing protein [Planctomycetota bacterium]|jgi:ketosteroid isomerase-like protein